MSNYLFLKKEDVYHAHSIPEPGNPAIESICIPCRELENMLMRYTTDPLPTRPIEAEGLFVHQKKSLIRINYEQIMWIEASRSYCTFHMNDGTSHTETYPLADMERYLPPNRFLRIHRSYTVNVRFVDSFCGNEVVIGSTRLPIGKQYKQAIDDYFVIPHSGRRR